MKKAVKLGLIVIISAAILAAQFSLTKTPIAQSESTEKPMVYQQCIMTFSNGTVVEEEWTAELQIIGYSKDGIPEYDIKPETIVILHREVKPSSAGALAPSSSMVLLYGYTFWTGSPWNSWYYVTASFGYTFSAAPIVTLGKPLLMVKVTI